MDNLWTSYIECGCRKRRFVNLTFPIWVKRRMMSLTIIAVGWHANSNTMAIDDPETVGLHECIIEG